MTDLKDFHDNLERINNINIQNDKDNFAIEFAEWLQENNIVASYKKLLQIFKEQKR